MGGLSWVPRLGVKAVAVCCVMAAVLAPSLVAKPALAASSAAPPEAVVHAAVFARADLGRGDVEWAAYASSTIDAVARALGATVDSFLPPHPGATSAYLVVMKGRFEHPLTGSMETYLRFVVFVQPGGTATSTLYSVSSSPPALGELGPFAKLSLPSRLLERFRETAGWVLILGAPVLLLALALLSLWSRCRWWVSVVAAAAALAVAALEAYMVAHSWPVANSSFRATKLILLSVGVALCVIAASAAARVALVLRRGRSAEGLPSRGISFGALVLATAMYCVSLQFLAGSGE
jgi:hypothetical protein